MTRGMHVGNVCTVIIASTAGSMPQRCCFMCSRSKVKMFAFAGQKFLLNMCAIMKICTVQLRQARRRDKSEVTIDAVFSTNVKEEWHHS